MVVTGQVYCCPLHQESVPTSTPMLVQYRVQHPGPQYPPYNQQAIPFQQRVHVYTRNELARSSRWLLDWESLWQGLVV